MKDTAIIMYSHSDYSDVWPIFFTQTDKYFQDVKKYIFADKHVDNIPSGL